MTADVQIPEPSQVIQDYLDAGNSRWTRGAMTREVQRADGTYVKCHCGAQILYDRLVEMEIVEGSTGSDVGVEHTIRRLYTLRGDEVDRAIEINDGLDPKDAATYAKLRRNVSAGGPAPLFEFLQEIAPKYLGRVRDYYRSIGR